MEEGVIALPDLSPFYLKAELNKEKTYRTPYLIRPFISSYQSFKMVLILARNSIPHYTRGVSKKFCDFLRS